MNIKEEQELRDLINNFANAKISGDIITRNGNCISKDMLPIFNYIDNLIFQAESKALYDASQNSSDIND